MARIVAGVFDDEQTATAAARELRRAGFGAGDLDQFSLSPPGRLRESSLRSDDDADPNAKDGDAGALKGAAIGSAIGAVAGIAVTPLAGPIAIAGGAAAGAYAGSLAGAVSRMGDDPHAPQMRPAGVMVAVNADGSDDGELAIDVLRERCARMIERAHGSWKNGKWADFDQAHAPDIVESRPAGSNENAPGQSSRERAP
ncbi:MAG TPA: hypothetical protein VIF33_06710 [Casimicrobiaceae bacterium]|jgi:hypothetical protein